MNSVQAPLFALGLMFLLTAMLNTLAYSQTAPLFQTQQQAGQHCPRDPVVWVNTQTGVYHFAGERWYGNTKHGAFVCKKEADQGGFRATRNGQ